MNVGRINAKLPQHALHVLHKLCRPTDIVLCRRVVKEQIPLFVDVICTDMALEMRLAKLFCVSAVGGEEGDVDVVLLGSISWTCCANALMDDDRAPWIQDIRRVAP